jgi:hypothetical protein
MRYSGLLWIATIINQQVCQACLERSPMRRRSASQAIADLQYVETNGTHVGAWEDSLAMLILMLMLMQAFPCVQYSYLEHGYGRRPRSMDHVSACCNCELELREVIDLPTLLPIRWFASRALSFQTSPSQLCKTARKTLNGSLRLDLVDCDSKAVLAWIGGFG